MEVHRVENRQEENTAYRLLFETSPQGNLLMENDIIIDSNAAAWRLLGYSSKEELLGQSIYDISPFQQSDGTPSKGQGSQHLLRALNDGTHTFKWVHTRRNGEALPLEVVLQALPMPGKKVFSVILKDISYKRMALDLREQNDQLYHVFFDKNNVAMLLIDPITGELVDANEAACAFYGYTKEQLLSMKITDINMLPAQEVHRQMEKVCGKQKNHFEFCHRVANGRIIQVEVESGLIQMNNRAVLYSIIHDTTEKKRAIERLQESERKFKALFDHANDAIFL